jgi:Tfp pilus assembly protein PilF
MSHASAHALLEQALQAMAALQWNTARALLERAIAGAPDDAALHTNLALALDETGDTSAALEHLSLALDLDPDEPLVHLNLGAILARQGMLALAESAYRQALLLQPESSAAWSNLGSLLDHSHRPQEAEACLQRALELAPDNDKAHFNLACLYLRDGRLHEAWPHWERRQWPVHQALPWPCPRWTGGKLQGAHILVVQDGGLGDTLQCARYLDQMRQQGAARIDLVCQAPLTPLLQQLPAMHTVWTWAESATALQAAAWDVWVPVMSLMACLDVSESPSTPAAYLHANAHRREHWAERLASCSHPPALRVCLVAQGNPDFPHDAQRSLHDADLIQTLLDVPGVDWICLHGTTVLTGDASAQPLGKLRDFDDTAALLAEMDLVVCVDTAVAHLAGAMGLACWILLPDYLCDWRWQRRGESSHWYPRTRLFRQSAPGDWAGVIRQVSLALQTPQARALSRSWRPPQTSA